MSMMIEETEGRHQGGRITHRDLLLSFLAAAMWRPRLAMGQPRVMGQSGPLYLPVRVSTLNHVSFGCAELARTFELGQSRLHLFLHVFNLYNRWNLRSFDYKVDLPGGRVIPNVVEILLPLLPSFGFTWEF